MGHRALAAGHPHRGKGCGVTYPARSPAAWEGRGEQLAWCCGAPEGESGDSLATSIIHKEREGASLASPAPAAR